MSSKWVKKMLLCVKDPFVRGALSKKIGQQISLSLKLQANKNSKSNCQ